MLISNFILPNLPLLHPDTKCLTLNEFFENHAVQLGYPTSIAAFDITQLQKINQEDCSFAGDQAIRILIQEIQLTIPGPIYLLHDFDAKLFAVAPHMSLQEMKKYAMSIKQEYKNLVFGLGEAEAEFCISEAIEEASESARIQQVLNPESKKHEPLFILMTLMKSLDKDWEAHIKRTQALSAKIAKKIDLSFLEQSQLQLACVLHDMGKLLNPQHFAQNITKEDKTQTKQYAQTGADFLSKMPSFENMALFIKYHHERFDGRGYPEGIAGHTIPLLSRIINLVDSYDSMLYNKTHKKALSKREIVEKLIREAGEQFDPYLTSILIEMIETGEITPEGENA